MYGRTGLKQQLEDLRDNVLIRDDLVKYLWYRAVNAPWKDQFLCAYTRYGANDTDVQLFRFLVRRRFQIDFVRLLQLRTHSSSHSAG